MKAEKRKERIDKGIKVRTDGIYALASVKDLTYLVMPRLILILGLLSAPLVMPDLYWQRVICMACVFALLSLSFDFLAHFTGLVSLGGALFIGLGGYITGYLNVHMGMHPFLTIPIATTTGAIIGALLLLPCLSLKDIYFAIVTLMYPLLLARIIPAMNILGGTDGIVGIDTFPNIWVSSYLVIAVTLLALFFLRRLTNEDYGMVLRSIKDNDLAVQASGINITRYKIQAVLMASALGSFSGAYLVHLYGWAGISLFALDFSILPIAATVAGGAGTLVGAVLGSLILTPVSESLRDFGTLRIVFYSLVLLGFILFNPDGMMNYLERKYHQFERWKEV
ncbi:ABC transporter permease [Candidatus Desulfarcum epimagneticum]|uniref:ABC transporter permease n=1 Tax=uncultured Desulfobacteraceae bacterium TaxID=218296 RepID=A0A484HCP7_9BACT|nr:ABC transporter permease [uncultured Desulfobacteraceae bacterium]